MGSRGHIGQSRKRNLRIHLYRAVGMANMIRAALPPHIHRDLKHLALDLKRPVQELLVDAAILLLQYHHRGTELPAPEPPKPSSPTRAKKGGSR